MIKVELNGAERLPNGLLDTGADITIEGDIKTVSIELANLITWISDNCPFVLDIAMKYIEDNNKYREEIEHDKTDFDNN